MTLTRTEEKTAALRLSPLLARCDQCRLEVLAAAADEARLPAGHVLVGEGVGGRSVYVLVEGELTVSVAGHPMAVLAPGSVAGELAIVDSGARATTIRTETEAVVLVIDRRDFAAATAQPRSRA
jgi:CRP-like cAMP-binding protein